MSNPILVFALAALIAAPRQDDAREVYAVIVNSNNPCQETGSQVKATIKKLFLKQLSQWSDGTEARPYARKDGDPEQTAFLEKVLGMDDAELARHWLKLKNMNGTTPPKSVALDRLILKYVAKHDGALGVVRLDKIKNAEGVRILYRF